MEISASKDIVSISNSNMVKRNLEGRTAFVTGASSGIGQAICVKLAKKGANICAVARRKEQLEDTAQGCQKFGSNVLTVCCDLHNVDDIKSAINQCIKQFGTVDILVNGAGIGGTSDDDLDKQEDCIAIDLVAVMRTCKLIAPEMEKKGKGIIINIASVAGKKANKGTAPSAKHGVVAYSAVLFEDLRDKGIKVCSINPGYVDTPLVSDTKGDKTKMIRAWDVAKTVSFVCKFGDTCCPTEIELMPQYPVK